MVEAAPFQVYGLGGLGPQPPSKVVLMQTALPEPGYMDSLWNRRRAIVKLCVLSLVVLLAISGHATVWHYLREYIEVASLTQRQELAIRLAYPLSVLAVLWHVKTFLSS